MLRGSSLHTGEKFEIGAVTSDQDATVGIAHETEIGSFLDATLRHDENALIEASKALATAVGPEAVVDSAAVIACFQRLNRMADGVGIALDEQMVIMTAGLRAELDIDDYATAANTPELSGLNKVQAFLMKPLQGLMMRAMQKGIQKAQANKEA